MSFDKNLLTKIAGFTKLAINEIDSLKKEISHFEQVARQEEALKENYASSVKLAAEALYSSYFITDEYEKKIFIKRAKEDPTYLAKVIEKVCNAADVSLIGKPARVARQINKDAAYDPVMAKAFGVGATASLVDI